VAVFNPGNVKLGLKEPDIVALGQVWHIKNE
jgi:hypothetical protein